MMIIPILFYVGLSALVALRGTQTRIGYWGTFFLSLLITPILMFVALLLLNPPVASSSDSARPASR